MALELALGTTKEDAGPFESLAPNRTRRSDVHGAGVGRRCRRDPCTLADLLQFQPDHAGPGRRAERLSTSKESLRVPSATPEILARSPKFQSATSFEVPP
jgi:hypothetical protein